jgi:hypothetical protein
MQRTSLVNTAEHLLKVDFLVIQHRHNQWLHLGITEEPASLHAHNTHHVATHSHAVLHTPLQTWSNLKTADLIAGYIQNQP